MLQVPLAPRQNVPFVCFNCRTSVKRLIPFYWEEAGERAWASNSTPTCPTCKRPMAYVGRYFKVPPRSALNQWRKAELLWQSGWIADGYSGSPRTLRDAREFVQKSGATAMSRALKRRQETEERWRLLRTKRAHLLRHKAA